MTAQERRKEIIKILETEKIPVSGTLLAKRLQVSRQIIVQDMAWIRAEHKEIYATPKGYMIVQPEEISKEKEETILPRKVMKVRHTDEQIEDELNTIVDNGGKILDVFIEHEIYGKIQVVLEIQCRKQVKEFMDNIQSGKSKPLKNLTNGDVHYHTVEAQQESILEDICKELRKKHYLVEE